MTPHPAQSPSAPDWFTPPRSTRHDLPSDIESDIPTSLQPGESGIEGFARALVAETCLRVDGQPVELSVAEYGWGVTVAITVLAPAAESPGARHAEPGARALHIEVILAAAGAANWTLYLQHEAIASGHAVGEPAPAYLADLIARAYLHPSQLRPDAPR